ncbi:MAG TPA: hypothetical protein VE170_12520, partial [Candidatus Limnocylindria bacterium]|nr:hypothetical protein [Candidatus Limnocylindria bacterium]
LYPALFGMIGGVLKSLCIAVGWILYPQGRDISTIIAGLYLSQGLFFMSICMTKGATEHSTSLLRTGALIGLLSGILATSAIVLFLYRGADLTAFDHAVVNGSFLGGAVGIVYGVGSTDRRWVYLIVGFLGGGIGVLSLHSSGTIADLTAMLLWKLSSSLDIAMVYGKWIVYPLDGITQSLLIWFSLAYAKEFFGVRDRN